MSKDEKEKRINSLALTFLERQQIVPNLYADQIIRGYKEGYHQAEKDLELTWKDFKFIHKITYETSRNVALNRGGYISEKEFYQEVLKRFKERKEK